MVEDGSPHTYHKLSTFKMASTIVLLSPTPVFMFSSRLQWRPHLEPSRNYALGPELTNHGSNSV